MSNFMSSAVVLAAALLGLAAVEFQVRADDRQPEKLTLQSGYSGEVLIAGARRVSLSVVLDRKGCGSGTLTLDPNIHES